MISLRRILIGFLALATVWVLGFAAFIGTIKAYKPSNSPADMIVVLTGGAERINTGLDLLEKNRAPSLFISGVNEDVDQNDIIKLWHPKSADAPCCITLGYDARNTEQNAVEVRNWVAQNPDTKSIILVTTHYHMPRSLAEIQKALKKSGSDVDIYPHPVITKERFWIMCFKEYHKTILRWLQLNIFPS